MPRPSKAAGSVALVTGANRGIGLAFVRELAARGAKKIYKEDPRDIARAGLDALDRGEHVADTDFMAIDARARYARDPIRYERGMTKLLKATTMDTGR